MGNGRFWIALDEVANGSETLEVPAASMSPVKVAFETFLAQDLRLDIADDGRPGTNDSL